MPLSVLSEENIASEKNEFACFITKDTDRKMLYYRGISSTQTKPNIILFYYFPLLNLCILNQHQGYYMLK